MTSINEKDAASKCSFLPMKSKQDGMPSCPMEGGNEASGLSNVEVDSATVYLLKKAASGIPHVANLLWGMLHELGIQEFGWDENIMNGIIDGMNAQTYSEVGSVTNSMLSLTISPYFYSALSTFYFEDSYSHDIPSEDDELPPVTSDISDSSSCEQNIPDKQGGLVFQSADLNMDESTQRLDYVITQVDISRMARTASRCLNVESIHQLPTITYRAESSLICSSHHEEENVDDFLLRNARIIEDYFDNAEENTEPNSEVEDPNNAPSFSWMMVPKDPTEDDVTRMSSIHAGEVPESISICKSNDSVDTKNNVNDDAYEYCVICQEPFQDGDCLRVLPCQHLFHCGCIDKWISGEISSDNFITSGCPMCKKPLPGRPSQKVVLDDCAQETQVGSYQSDGSVPPWMSTELGNLMSGIDNERTSSA